MKSINQIFETNPHLKDEPEVKELIEYCQEMEGIVMDNLQTKKFSFEDKLTELVREIFSSIKTLEHQEHEHQRFGQEFAKPDYEQSIKNLKQYFLDFAEENKFRL